ncbi:hypothetical protein OBBRIDRAFT_65992 [Obba rivulosa]|uniref:Uncharacterized protein n=1 Tax=Obba rivulosa TaxID=1052685 RepID=A0A8E2AVB6_9APHY|nr:hypothetical protein OBBRIDRAFT_65992 [Obba rivulosa]
MALSCLPKNGLSATEKQLKQQSKSGLVSAQRMMSAAGSTPNGAMMMAPAELLESRDTPWARACAILPQLQRGRKMENSAWGITKAHDDYAEGVQMMKLLRKKNGNKKAREEPLSTTFITNDLLRDERSFYMDCEDFQQKTFKGWSTVNFGAGTVKEPVPKVAETKGWSVALKAMEVTIRHWILNGFLCLYSATAFENTLHSLNCAVDSIEWSMMQCPNTPTAERGIFEHAFLRGVMRLRLKAYTKARKMKGPKSGYTLQGLISLAQDLIDNADTNPPSETTSDTHVGFLFSFWAHHKAGAYSALAYAYLQMAMKSAGKMPRSTRHQAESSRCYKTAI